LLSQLPSAHFVRALVRNFFDALNQSTAVNNDAIFRLFTLFRKEIQCLAS